jgi:glucan phosphoethanolaminetransferase (alkaline phosphatase superfamily)
MWQRVQSLLLLVSILGSLVFLGTNSYVKMISPNEKLIVNSFQVLHQKGSEIEKVDIYYIAILVGLSILLTVFTIFQYKDRVKQMLFVALNSLFLGVALAITVYHIQKTAVAMNGAGGEYYFGIGGIFVALIANWLANRFIKKDEKLVKDSDSRLR